MLKYVVSPPRPCEGEGSEDGIGLKVAGFSLLGCSLAKRFPFLMLVLRPGLSDLFFSSSFIEQSQETTIVGKKQPLVLVCAVKLIKQYMEVNEPKI